MTAGVKDDSIVLASGPIVRVRDEDWLATAVVLDIDEQTVRELSDDGWRVVGPDVVAIVEALSAPEGAR